MNIKGMLVLDIIIGGDFNIQNFTCIVHAKIKTMWIKLQYMLLLYHSNYNGNGP